MPTLIIQFPGSEPVSHVLKDDTVTIGRMKGNTIVVNDDSVSLMHARITRKGGEYFLKDLNSTNGTTVNGQPILEVKLRDRDRVCFADVTGQLEIESAAPAATSAPVSAPGPALQISNAARVNPTPITPAASQKVVRPKSTSSVSRFVNASIAVAGGVAVLTVISFVGWRLLHNGESNSRSQQSRIEQATSTATKSPVVAEKKNLDPAASSDPAPSAPQATITNQNISRLVVALTDPAVEERRRAARALHSAGLEAAEAAGPLREALLDADEEVQMWSALTLVNTQNYERAAIPILIRVLHHENPALRQVACLSLALIPYQDAEKDIVVPALALAAGRDDTEEVRKAALSALNIIAPETVARSSAQ